MEKTSFKDRRVKFGLARGLFFAWRIGLPGLFSLITLVCLANSVWAGSVSDYKVNGASVPLESGVDIGVLSSATGVLRGAVNNNNIVLNSGSSADPYYIFGGLDVQDTANAAVTKNSVTLNGGAVVENAAHRRYSGSVTAGFAFTNTGNALATYNQIILNNVQVEGSLTGGWARVDSGSGSATASYNTVNLLNGQVKGSEGATAGWAEAFLGSGASSNFNTLNMSGGVLDSSSGAVGGWAYLNADSGKAETNNNTLNLSGGQIVNSEYNAAGYVLLESDSSAGTGQAIANNNKVSLSGNALIDDGGALIGGWARAESGLGVPTALNNQVNMTGGTVQGGGDIYYGYGSVIGGWAQIYYGEDVAPAPALASGNMVTMNGGAIKDGGNLVGGWSRAHNGYGSATASGNIVNMSGGSLSDTNGLGDDVYDGSVFGGYVRVSSLGDQRGVGLASDNTVNISGGAVNDGGSVYGGFVYAYKNKGQATGNVINMSGGQVSGSVYGGWARASEGQALAKNNTINLSGGNIAGDIYGGFAEATLALGQVATTGNTVNISGASVFTSPGVIYGGYGAINGVPQNVFSNIILGNTLNLNNTAVAVTGVENFENYNFLLPANNARPLISVNNPMLLSGGAGAGAWQSKVAFSGVASGQKLNPGTKFTLINKVDGLGRDFKLNGKTFSPDNNTVVGVKQGIALKYDMKLFFDGDALNYDVASVQAADEARAPLEGRAASIGFVTGGSDLIAGAGMEHAMIASGTANPDQGGGLASGDAPAMGLKPFAAVNGGFMRYNTGGHVDVNGLSYMLGLAKSVDAGPGSLLAAVFFENGYGSYDTHYSTGNGDGHTNYYGGGVLARYDLTSGALEGLYSEASLRMGSLHNEYNGEASLGLDSGRYTTNTLYYGAHAGLGYVCVLGEAATLDTSVKYLWAHQNADDVTILGDEFNFKATNSYRLRPGTRLTYAITDAVKPYVGAAYEYEFGGKAKATTYGLDIAAPAIKGSSGMGEIGLALTPGEDKALRLDFGVQTYFGKREGVMGTASLSYEF